MFEQKVRGKNKVVKPLGIKDMYKYFSANTKLDIEYKEYSKILKECNKELVDIIVKEAKVFDMPYRLGILQVSKFERGFNKSKSKWAVDYKKSKELGFIVYHDSENIYKFNWKKTKAKFINKTGYKFKANRKAARLIPHMLKTTKIDYYK